MNRTPLRAVSGLALMGFLATSCGSRDTNTTTVAPTAATEAAAAQGPTTGAQTTQVATVTGDLVVFAASSLTKAFTEIGDAFEKANPGANVTFNFAGSSDLVTQITQGAPADVFVSADESNMKKLVDADEAAGIPVIVAKNTFEIIVEKGDPKGVASVAGLANPDVIVVLCADSVPCGKGAATILKNANVTVTPKSLEDKVTGVVAKVTAGEADAGIVYVTDVEAAGDKASGIDIPADQNVISNYPIVVTKSATNASSAQSFVDFVAGSAGQAILAKYGFLAP
jgi:molybdate transport system substrate-binding protein